MYFSWAEYRIRVYFNFGKALTCGACLSAAKPPCAVCRLATWGGAVRHTPGHNRPASTAPIRAAILSELARWPLTASGAPSRAELSGCPCVVYRPDNLLCQPPSCAAEARCHPREASLLHVHQSPSSPKELLQQPSCISSLPVPVQRPLLHRSSGSSVAMLLSERACHRAFIQCLIYYLFIHVY
jgi:hypothetical protein